MTNKVFPKPEQYASCPSGGKILEFYKGQFDSVYVLLHPFFYPKSIELERFCPEQWPSNHEIIAKCETILWKRILELTDLRSLSEIDVGLRTSISSLKKELENETYAACLNKLTEINGIIHPSEGELSPFLKNRVLDSIKALGHDWLWVGDEFGTERKLNLIDDIIEKDEIPIHGCVFTHDHSLLVTTHWDSHCSFLCSSETIIKQILAVDNFEGFFCTKNTEVYWGLHQI